MEAQPVTPGAALFSQAQVDALRRLKDAFEQKLLDEDEYKALLFRERAQRGDQKAGGGTSSGKPDGAAEPGGGDGGG